MAVKSIWTLLLSDKAQTSLMKFLDKLKLPLDKQIVMDRAREELLKWLAVANANLECKKLLHALPPEPEPTIAQIIDACNHLATPEHTDVLQAQVLADSLTAFQENANRQQDLKWKSCHNCGRDGHCQGLPKGKTEVISKTLWVQRALSCN